MYKYKNQISTSKNWDTDMESQIPVMLHKNTLKIKNEFGISASQNYELQPGLWIKEMNFKGKGSLDVEVLPKTTKDAFCLNLWITNAQVKLLFCNVNKGLKFKYENFSVVLVSASMSSSFKLPENQSIRLVTVWVTREWLLANVVETKNKAFSAIFETNEPIYLTESLDYQFKCILEQLDFSNSGKLNMLTNTLQLLNYFFKKMKKQEVDNLATVNIHCSDQKKLVFVKEYIHANSLIDFSLGQLSEIAGMSLSKFKRLFKNVYGTTPYKYCMEHKLNVAMEMLQKESYSVSQTGFMIGYSNLSQFSKAFKNKFGQLPSQVRV